MAARAPSANALYWVPVTITSTCNSSLWATYSQNFNTCYQEYLDNGTPTTNYIGQSDYDALTNIDVSAGLTADQTSIPADIPATQAADGAADWNGLSGALSSLKTSAMDFLGGMGDWPVWRAFGAAGLGVGAFKLGWDIGSGIADVLGIDSNPCTSGCLGQSPSGLSAVSAGDCLPTYGQNPTTTCPGSIPSGGCPDGTGECSATGQVAPSDGWIVEWSSSGATISYPVQSVNSIPPGASVLNTTMPCCDSDNTGSGGADPAPSQTTEVYFIPAQITALPGAGQNNNVAVTGADTGTITLPSESQQKTNAQSILQAKRPGVGTPGSNATAYGPWNAYVCTTPDSPCQGASTTGTGVTVIAIPAPSSNTETYAQYVAQLRAAGLLGTITETILTQATASSAYGPNAAVGTTPAVGTQVAPSTAIAVAVNPDSTTSTTTGSAPVGPTLPGLTIPAAATPCNVFPFGIPCWVATEMGTIASAGPEAPAFNFNLPAVVGGAAVSIDLNQSHFGFDFKTVMDVVRPILLFASFLGIAVWLGGIAMGGSTDPGESTSAGSSE